MVCYSFFIRNEGPVEVVCYDRALDVQNLNALTEQVEEEHHYVGLEVDLLRPSQAEQYLKDNPETIINTWRLQK